MYLLFGYCTEFGTEICICPGNRHAAILCFADQVILELKYGNISI
jgi:hypothetical protein